MEAWEYWWRMARESLAASKLLADQGRFRSGASRSYYAAYQAASAVLLYLGATPPEGREAWSHEATPALLRQRLSVLLRQTQSADLARRLSTLYKLRVEADYVSAEDVDADAARGGLKNASFFVKVAGDILVG